VGKKATGDDSIGNLTVVGGDQRGASAGRTRQRQLSKEDLNAFAAEVHAALFRSLDRAFPEFGWTRDGAASGWTATNRATTKEVAGARPDRVICKKPQGFYVHGADSTLWMAYLNGGTYPKGARYFEVLKDLAGRAGVDASLLDHALTEEERVRHEQQAHRRGVLESALELAQEVLWSGRGEVARTYLQDKRGFTDKAIRDLGLGLWPGVDEVRKRLGADLPAADEAGLLWPKMEGYIIIPWADAAGLPLTFYGRWPGDPPLMKDHPGWRSKRDAERLEWERKTAAEKAAAPWEEPKVPKTNALPGVGTKGSPLYFDRARKAGHRDLVAVEGVFDAALLQACGDARVVAYVGAQFTTDQVKTLARHKVRSVVVVPDPDGGGDQGAVHSVTALEKAGILSYPKLRSWRLR
jgi:hypothetical protein